MVLPTANWKWYDHLESISYESQLHMTLSVVSFGMIQFNYIFLILIV